MVKLICPEQHIYRRCDITIAQDELNLISHAAETEEYAELVEDTTVYILYRLYSLGAPYWDMYARGIVTLPGAKEHIIRAALESIAYQSMDVIRTMEEDVKST